MAVHFALTRKNSTTKLPFNTIDEEICASQNIKPSETEYYLGWYNTLGLKIALGHSFGKIRNNVDKELLPVVEFIENNYDTHHY